MAQVIVGGGGLPGVSAVHTLLERGANAKWLDKRRCVSRLRLLRYGTSLGVRELTHRLQIPGRQLHKDSIQHQRPRHIEQLAFPTMRRLSSMIPRNQ